MIVIQGDIPKSTKVKYLSPTALKFLHGSFIRTTFHFMDIADKSAKRESFPVAQSKLSVSKTNEDESGEVHLLNIRTQILRLHQKRGTLSAFQSSALDNDSLVDYWYILDFDLLMPRQSKHCIPIRIRDIRFHQRRGQILPCQTD